jgi:hypothetical protein
MRKIITTVVATGAILATGALSPAEAKRPSSCSLATVTAKGAVAFEGTEGVPEGHVVIGKDRGKRTFWYFCG